MSDTVKQIGARIKELRVIARLTPEALAREFRISVEDYRAYESGGKDIPVGLLYELSHKFNVELTTLLTGEEPRLRSYCLVKKGAGLSVQRRKQYRYQDLAYNFAHKKAEAFLVTVPATGKKKPQYYAHPGQEFTYLLEGNLKVILQGHALVLQPGDSLYFDSGLEHAMEALHGKPAKFLAVIV